jgi:folate-binding protein YgfZ
MSSPFDDQRALAEGRAVARLERGIVTVAGADRLSWLDSFTSQALTNLAPGASAETLLLDPNGRVEHAMRVVDDGDTAWLVVDTAGEAAVLAAWLDRMRFMLRVEVADRSTDYDVVGSVAALELVPGAIVWRDPWGDGVAAGGVQYAAEADHPATDWSWYETLLPSGTGPGLPIVPTGAAEALRVAAWRPAFAAEVDERTIPHELDWLRTAVHLEKGCYRGQETVAKVHNLGHPPRRLVFLHVDGSDNVVPHHGDPVVIAGADDPIGAVTSAANHYQLGPIALAVVKRSADPGATLEVLVKGSRLAASQEVVVPTDAGAAVDIPRIPRLGAVRR